MVLEKTLESPLDCKEIQPVHPKGDQSWVFIGRTDAEAETPNTLATSCEELTHWKRPWCLERLRAGGEGDDRGWDGWMASPTRWTWVWVNFGSWWWTGRPGVLRFMEWDTTEQLNWTELRRQRIKDCSSWNLLEANRQETCQGNCITKETPRPLTTTWNWLLGLHGHPLTPDPMLKVCVLKAAKPQ